MSLRNREPLHHPRLILFPGLGADGRLFEPQRRAFPWLEAPPWIPPLPRESLQSYGRRMAERITPGGRIFLGGVSLGAIVAMEAAKHVSAEGVFSIGGGRDSRAIAPWIRWVFPIAPFIPAPLIHSMLTLFPLGLQMIEDLSHEHRRLYAQMARDTPPSWIRWGLWALHGWRLVDPPHARIYEIHGEKDMIVPVKNVKPEFIIRNGRHLVSLSQPDEVNAIIARSMLNHLSATFPETTTFPLL